MPRPVATDILHVGEQSQLFVDDHVVAATERLTRRLHAVEKDPANPVLRPELPCEGTSIEYTSVLWDEEEQRFKTWYLCGDNQDARASPGMKSRFEIRSCYATSADGVNWDKPDLGLIECGGSQRSNAIDSGRWLQGVVHTGPDREPDARRRYKMLAWVTGGYQAAFSRDVSSQGALASTRICCASLSSTPQLIAGGCSPSPMKLSEVSPMIMPGIDSVSEAIT